MISPRHLVPLSFVMAVCGTLSSALAQGFEIRPLLIETRDGNAAITLTNPTNRRIYVRGEVLDWSQDPSGRDVLTRADDAIASPPATWIEPSGTYVFRIRLPAPRSGEAERAFRLDFQQLPSREDLGAGRVVFSVTQRLPAFYQARDGQPPSLRARLINDRTLLIYNDGERRARLSDVSQSGRVLAPGLVGYALPKSAVRVSVPAGTNRSRIEVQTDLGPRAIDVR
jgi:P pilus assembly chaperone PapD